MTPFFNFSALRASLAIGVIVLSAAAPAQAVVYDFKKTGGPGGTVGSGSDIFVEVTENLLTVANDVLFKFTSELPIYNPSNSPSISRLYFDTGSYTSLFSGSLSITETSGLVNLVPKTPASHPFLPLTPDYQFGLSNTFPLDNPINGINPGEYAVVSATLGGSNTFADVISSMNVGLGSATGLRIGVFAFFLNGTGLDDGGFVTNSVVAVPEAETWAMLLAGLGLVGFMARRRTA